MNRVLAARSLKFSEHRGNEASWSATGDPARNEVLVHKKSEMNKKGDGGKLRTAYSTSAVSAHEKLKTPSIVAALLQREAEKKKKAARGVWSPLGQIYSTHGTPDLDLGDAKAHNKKVLKAPHGNRRSEVRMEETQKLGKLVTLFDETRAMCAVNLFNRPGQKHTEGGNQSTTVRASMSETSQTSQNPSPRSREETNFRTRAMETTSNKIARLGIKDGASKRMVKKKLQDKSLVSQIDHLREDRTHHLARWRGGFEETKSSKNNVLIQHLVKRSEDRGLVNMDHALMNNAYDICEKGSLLLPGQLDNQTIWERARMMGTYAQNAQFKAMQNKEASKAVRAPFASTGVGQARAPFASTGGVGQQGKGKAYHTESGIQHGRRAARPVSSHGFISSPESDNDGQSVGGYMATPHMATQQRTMSKSATTPQLSRVAPPNR